MEGRKDDQGKARMDLIPPELLEGVGQVLAFGAAKYSERNWERGMAWGRVYGALQRHLNAWWGGESHDNETGMPHLWHAGCCLAFLIAYERRGIGADDRKPPAQVSIEPGPLNEIYERVVSGDGMAGVVSGRAAGADLGTEALREYKEELARVSNPTPPYRGLV